MMDTMYLLDRNAVTQRCPDQEPPPTQQLIDDEREHVTVSGICPNQSLQPPAGLPRGDERDVRPEIRLRDSEFFHPFSERGMRNHDVPHCELSVLSCQCAGTMKTYTLPAKSPEKLLRNSALLTHGVSHEQTAVRRGDFA